MTDSTPFSGEAQLAEEIVRRMGARGLHLGTVDATTGGLIGHLIVSVPGASKIYQGGVAPYARPGKLTWLDMDPEIFTTHGSVHVETALAMARGVRDALGVEVGIAESGIASPTDNPERPGGLYCLAIVGPNGYERSHREIFPGDRTGTMHAAAERLLRMVVEYLDHLDGLDATGRT